MMYPGAENPHPKHGVGIRHKLSIKKGNHEV